MGRVAASAANGPAFITGGTSGIGLATALLLARQGHDLALIARDPEKLAAAKALIAERSPSVRVETFSADVSDRAACEAAVSRAAQALGAPRWAVASAGIACPGHFLDQPAEDHEEQMGVNYFGSLYFARAVAPLMIGAGGGRLVFVASGAAFFGIYGYSAYAPSKFAVRGLAEVLRVELAPHGVAVTLCYPPDTDTPQLEAEARTKPAATKAITAGGGLWSADRVAEVMVAGARKNRFVVAPGLQMGLLTSTHSLLSPALRFYQSSIVRKQAAR